MYDRIDGVLFRTITGVRFYGAFDKHTCQFLNENHKSPNDKHATLTNPLSYTRNKMDHQKRKMQYKHFCWAMKNNPLFHPLPDNLLESPTL